MSITVTERWGRRLSGDQAERVYTITGTSSDTSARAALLAAAPLTHDDLPRSDNDAEVDEIEGVGAFIGTVLYRFAGSSNPQEGESSYSFETSGGTQHITQAVGDQTAYDANGAIAVDPFGGAIGVSDDSVEGVDTTVPIFTFSETHFLSAATVTNAYKGTLHTLTGKVNDALFKGLASGECLFLGATGTRRGDNPWEIQYLFAASPNETALTVNDITVAAKLGWQYLWTKYQAMEDDVNKLIVRKPAIAVVSDVYKFGDLSLLGIGTT